MTTSWDNHKSELQMNKKKTGVEHKSEVKWAPINRTCGWTVGRDKVSQEGIQRETGNKRVENNREKTETNSPHKSYFTSHFSAQ